MLTKICIEEKDNIYLPLLIKSVTLLTRSKVIVPELSGVLWRWKDMQLEFENTAITYSLNRMYTLINLHYDNNTS